MLFMRILTCNVCTELVYGPIYDLEKLELQKKLDKAQGKEDEEEPIGVSPCGRFVSLAFDISVSIVDSHKQYFQVFQV